MGFRIATSAFNWNAIKLMKYLSCVIFRGVFPNFVRVFLRNWSHPSFGSPRLYSVLNLYIMLRTLFLKSILTYSTQTSMSNVSILRIFSFASKIMQFLQPPSLYLLSSPLRITNTTADHNYFVKQSPWEVYSLWTHQYITCLLRNLLRLLRPPLESVVSRKMQSIYSYLIPLRLTLILYAHLCIYLAKCSCHWWFPAKYYTFVINELRIYCKYSIHVSPGVA